MEFAEGNSLAELCKKYRAMGENTGLFFFKQLLDSLEYLQENKVAHLDLKPHNMLLTRDLTLKLTDFGISQNQNTDSLSKYCGTHGYMAPEIAEIRKSQFYKPYNGHEADVFSAGVCLFNFVCGVSPFKQASSTDDYNYFLISSGNKE